MGLDIASYTLKNGILTRQGAKGGDCPIKNVFNYDSFLWNIDNGIILTEIEFENVCIEVHTDEDECECRVLKFFNESNEDSCICIKEGDFHFENLYSGEQGITDVATVCLSNTYDDIEIICKKKYVKTLDKLSVK